MRCSDPLPALTTCTRWPKHTAYRSSLHTDHWRANCSLDRWVARRERGTFQGHRPAVVHLAQLTGEEPIEENIATCKPYLERMHGLGMFLEIELGVTGGEEDGVDNTDIDSSKLYTQPEGGYAYEDSEPSAINSRSLQPLETCTAYTSQVTSPSRRRSSTIAKFIEEKFGTCLTS